MSKILGVIPARLRSSRLHHKMLADIHGKPLIWHTWNQAKKAKMLDEVVVATDSKKISAAIEKYGGKAVMTSVSLASGSDRVAEAARSFRGFTPNIIVNIQGDEPLLSPEAIDDSVKILVSDKDASISTPATQFKNTKDIKNPNFVKVVLDRNNYALYFSRSVIPYPRGEYKNYLRHIGLYAFRKDMLSRFTKLGKTPLEVSESLEQLRLLENGYRIKVAVGKYTSVSVDVEEDLKRVRKLIAS